jgi:hypothetical protein
MLRMADPAQFGRLTYGQVLYGLANVRNRCFKVYTDSYKWQARKKFASRIPLYSDFYETQSNSTVDKAGGWSNDIIELR